MISQENLQLAERLLPIELWNTIYMIVAAAFFAALVGFPLGIILSITDKDGIKPQPTIYKILSWIVNIGRSIPFAILIIAIIPFTRFIVGTSLGTTASIVPLAVAAAPFIARLVEMALKEVDREMIEAAHVMGSSTTDIICKVLLPESLPSLISGMTITLVSLVGYSAMAGLVGGGGLGRVAIQYGYNQFNGFMMLTTVILLVILVQVIQWLGNLWVRAILRKRGKKTA